MTAPYNEYAFPVPASFETTGQQGMTLRDWFAGMVANGLMPHEHRLGNAKTLAQISYLIADALCEARNQKCELARKVDAFGIALTELEGAIAGKP